MNKPRAKMPPSQRAKQFAPFDAVVGLRRALYEKERIRAPRKLLSEDMIEEIDRALKELNIYDIVTVTHYNNIEQKYIKTTGVIKKIDAQKHLLTIDTTDIIFSNIYTITNSQ